ncbi:MAG TPA: hypothetical protein V6C81_01285 [Planktothrix sp.]|jgi:hypothetical protein
MLISERWRDKLSPFAALLVIALSWSVLACSIPRAQFKESDTFWLIEVGNKIVHDFALPTSDCYSYMSNHGRWIVYQWLTEVIFSLSNRAGLIGVALVGDLILTYTLGVLLLRQALKFEASPLVSIFLIAITFFATYPDIATLRPQLFSFACFVLLHGVAETAWAPAERRSLRRQVFLSALIGVAWVNLHASFALGAGLLFVYLLAALISNLKEGGNYFRTKTFVAILVSYLLSSLINPYGFELWNFVARLNNNFETQEMKALDFVALGPYGAIYILLLLVMLANFKRKPQAAIAGLALFVCGATHARLIIYFCLFACPHVSRAVTEFLPTLRTNRLMAQLDLSLARILNAWFFPIIPVAISIIALFVQPMLVPRSLPLRAAEYLALHPPRGRLFSTAHAGSYLMYRFHGLIKVFMDPRLDLYDPALCARFAAALHGDHWRELLLENNVRETLLPVNSPLQSELQKSADWSEIYSDNDFAISTLRDH